MEDAWFKITQSKFGLSEYLDSTGRKLPMYELTKTESLYVATKFNDEARARLILRWEELERKQSFNVPQSFSGALRLALEQAEAIERQQLQIESHKKTIEIQEKNILVNQKQISTLKPKAESLDFGYSELL